MPTQQEIVEANADVRGIRQRESYLLHQMLLVGNPNVRIHADVSAAAAFMNEDASDTLGGTMFKPVLYNLIRQMKMNILPAASGGDGAVIEAFLRSDCKNCKAEFGSKRLELFLRKEAMDPILAASRFVRYWKRRKELFGSDMFHLPLKAEGALKADIASLELGRFVILPKPDNFGRTIMLHSEHTPPYNLQSMVRYCVRVFVR